MSRFDDRESVSFGPWPFGSNNLAREDSLPRGHLRFAKNTDIYPSGKARERPGFTLRQAVVGDSLWSDGSLLVYRADNELRRFDPQTNTSTTLFSGLFPAGGDLVYCETPQGIYISDSRDAWHLDPYALTVRPWGLLPPQGPPMCAASNDGGLFAGTVQVAITYSMASGEESGASPAVSTLIPAFGGVQLSSIPQPMQAHAASINVYATAPNGTEFEWVSRLPVGTTSYLVGTGPRGRVLQSQFYTSMPAGQCATEYNGVLYVGVGRLLLWSPPLWYGQCDMVDNYIEFGADIDMITPAGPRAGGGGVFVAAGRKTTFHPGAKPKDFKQVDVASGAIRGSCARVPGDMFKIQGLPSYELPLWVDRDGFLTLGLADGTTLRPTSDRYVMERGETAATFVRSLRGVSQYVVTMPGPTAKSAMAFTDAAEMTLIRRADPC